MRMAGSLKLGTIHASELIRSLLRSSRPSGLAQAIMEVGRVNKTLYLLNYIDDEDYRRRILTQLNWGEGRHAVARAICYGQRGEIRKRYREGQEDQLGALGTVTNAVVLWNTLYMQEALSHLRKSGKHLRRSTGKIVAADTWPYKYAGALYVFVTRRYFEGRVKTIKFQYKQ